MILAIDVQYVDAASGDTSGADAASTGTDTGDTCTTGYASGVLFASFSDPSPLSVYSITCPNVAPYIPGSFFKRELPPVLAVVAACPTPPTIIVIDGFVDLALGKPGLGRHLFDHLGGETVVIGVAKSPFRSDRDSIRGTSSPQDTHGGILRGTSSRPLYVTAAGIGQESAERWIQGMHGKNRIPTMLKLVDTEARRAAKES